MKVIIVEDEKLAVERLHLLLKQIDGAIQVTADLESVEEAVNFFTRRQSSAEVLLIDIHLADGSAFEIFRRVPISNRVIFITAYDRYAIDAFNVLCIDYLLKPITLESLTKALRKIELMQAGTYGPADYTRLGGISPLRPASFKSRFLGRIGQRLFFINADDIAMISADNRIVHIVAMDKTKYLIDHTLDELENDLEPSSFFRINRSTIVHARAIGQIKPFINHRLKLVLKIPLQTEEIVVSRDRVPHFKKWAES